MQSFVFRVTRVSDVDVGNPRRIERTVDMMMVDDPPGGASAVHNRITLSIVEGGEMFKAGHKYIVDIREA